MICIVDLIRWERVVKAALAGEEHIVDQDLLKSWWSLVLRLDLLVRLDLNEVLRVLIA